MKEGLKDRLQNLRSFISFSKPARILFVLFLFPIFFVMHGNNENFGIIPASVLGSLLLSYLLITLVVLLTCLLIFRGRYKAFIFAFYLLAIFFFYGAAYDALQSWFPGGFLSSYRFIGPALLILTGLLYVMLQFRKENRARMVRYLSMLLLLLVILELATTIYYQVSGREKQNDLAGVPPALNNGSCEGDKPDIYFIVFDSYASSVNLRDAFEFNNSSLDSLLLAHNFFLSKSSKSNYNFTAYSLGASFGLNYMKPGVEQEAIQPRNFMQAVNSLRRNSFVNFLANKGYSFKNFGRFEMEHMPAAGLAYFDYFFYDLIDYQTLYRRVKSALGYKLRGRNLLTGGFQAPASYIQAKKRNLQWNKDNLANLLKEFSLINTAPRFVYTHLMLPHEPFYLHADGSEVADSAMVFHTRDDKQGYLDQVQYANTLIKEIIDAAEKSNGREKVIIIEGDHGFRLWDKGKEFLEFPNLNTYYFSDHDYRSLYDGISPVNSFRVLLNKYFCQQLPMLKDSSIYLKTAGQ